MAGRRAEEGASSAGASAWARYRELASRQRHERIATRLVLSSAAGVFCTGLLSWRYGLVAASAVVVAHVLYVRQRPGPMTDWRRGALAERRTGRRLARLDPSVYHVLHDRALPATSMTNLDHLVIGLTGVYAVVTRHWPPGTRLRAERRRLWAGRRALSALPGDAARTAEEIADLLSYELGQDIPVEAVVAVHGARLPHAGLTYRGVSFQRAARLTRYIRTRPTVFTGAQVATIAAAAQRTLPPMRSNGAIRRISNMP